MKNYLIGISGGSGAGKTTIVKSLVDHYQNKAAVLELDSYYKDFSDLTFDNREKLNFDHPKSFDYKLLKAHINLLLQNEKIKSPIYDYKKHKRKENSKTIYPNKLIFLEGTLIFYFAEIVKFMSLKIFIHAKEKVLFSRRLNMLSVVIPILLQHPKLCRAPTMLGLFVLREPTQPPREWKACAFDRLDETMAPLFYPI